MKWINQEDSNLMDHCVGSTVLIKFKSTRDGITADDDSTIDLSWLRDGEKVHATTGTYTTDEIREWAVI